LDNACIDNYIMYFEYTSMLLGAGFDPARQQKE
jgi:hypothetical protein